jgi:hypothetical protein
MRYTVLLKSSFANLIYHNSIKHYKVAFTKVQKFLIRPINIIINHNRQQDYQTYFKYNKISIDF